jgi:signal transduction histidine kinase
MPGVPLSVKFGFHGPSVSLVQFGRFMRHLNSKRLLMSSAQRLRGGVALALALALPFEAAAAEGFLANFPLPATFGSLEVIQFSMFLGAMGAALLSAVWLIRERGKIAGENQVLRARVSDLTSSLQRADALAASRDHRVVIWDRSAEKPELVGTLPAKSGAPADRASFLAFGRWLMPLSAAALDRAIAALRTKATPFDINVETSSGMPLEVQGRTSGTSAFVRFVSMGELQSVHARLQAEFEELNSAYLTLSALFDALPMPAWKRGLDGTINWANKKYKALDDAPSQGRYAELFGEQARQSIAAKRGIDGVFQDEVIAVASGDRRVFRVTDIALPSGSAGLALDISDEEMVREEYERTLKSHSDTLDQLTTAVAIFDDSQKLRFYNNAFQTLWGLDSAWLDSAPDNGAVLDRLRSDGKLPEQPEWRRWRESMLAAYRAPDAAEHWWYLPDGKTIRVIANPQPKGGAIWVFENLTEKFDLESKFNSMVKIQGETLDHLAEGVVVFGSDGKVRLANPAFSALWALPDELVKEGAHITAIQNFCEQLTTQTQWAGFVGAVTGFDDSRQPKSGHIELSSGGVLAYAQVPLPKGQTMLTFVDVTDSVNVERALTERNEALLRTDQLKTEFVQHVSYELRSPLTNIMGFTELLEVPATGPLTDRQREYVEHISTSSASLLAIVNDILDLASIDAGVMELDLAEVGTKDLIDAAVASCADRFADNSIKVEVHVEPAAKAFRADALRMRQVLFNLLANAANHAPENSIVSVSCTRDNAIVELSVSDNGPGIPDDVVETVFNRFQRSGATGRKRGTGLGLALVKSFVELHGGSVMIETGPDRGTKVICRMPVVPQKFAPEKAVGEKFGITAAE